jgi:hypothetical protein
MRLKERDHLVLRVLNEHGWLMTRDVTALTKDIGSRISLHQLFFAGFLERDQPPGYRHYRYRLTSAAGPGR